MIVLRIVLAALGAALAGLVVWAALAAPIGASFSTIAADPWGLVTLADLYLGLAVACVVVALVERPLVAAAWIVALLALGNVVSAIWLAYRLPGLAGALRRPR